MEGFKVGVRNSPSGFPPVSALSTSLSLSSLSSLPRSLARSLPPAYRSCLSDKIGVLVLQLPRRVVSVLGTMYIPMFGRKSSNVFFLKKVQVTPPVIPIAKTCFNVVKQQPLPKVSPCIWDLCISFIGTYQGEERR